MSNSNDRSEYKVGQLAALAKVGLGTVRHYQKLGLLPIPPRFADGGARRYTKAQLDHLLLIRNMQALGFSLREISAILSYRSQNNCQPVKRLCVEKQNALRNQIREQEARLKALKMLAEICPGTCSVDECAFFQELSCLSFAHDVV